MLCIFVIILQVKHYERYILTKIQETMGITGIIVATFLGLGITATGPGTQKEIVRKGGAHVKIGLNAYSFNNLLNEHLKGEGKGISLFDLLDFCAENNIDALDPTSYYFPGYPGVPEDEFIYDFKLRAHHLGVAISGTGVRTNFANPDDEARAADVRHVKDWIEVAAKLGAPVIRVFAGRIPEGYEDKWEEVASWIAESIRECADYGEKMGVIVAVQNHGGMLRTADQCIRLIELVDSRWFGLVVDTYYFMTDDPYAEIEKVIPYAVNWQVKERIYGGDNIVYTDIPRLMKIMNRAGYRGYIPVETLPLRGTVYDPVKLVPQFVDKVRRAIESEF
jgi:sugar phosphate isomerase/epimerase